jgi:hypothetical protein
MSHTKEPWQVTEGDLIITDKNAVIAVASSGCGYNGNIRPRTISDEQKGENARRIVACVNACAGIQNDILENEMFRGAMNSKAYLIDAIQQRDELLEALKKITYQSNGKTFIGIVGDTDVTELVGAAIANAEAAK